MTAIILVANEKGGVGKTMIASHIAWLADELGLRVLAIDTDTQTAMYRRLSGKEPSRDHVSTRWGNQRKDKESSSMVWYVPASYDAAKLERFDLAVIDTKGSDKLASGPVPDLVIVPINGEDALRETNNTIANVRQRSKTVPIYLMLNRISIGGSSAKAIRLQKQTKLPPNVEWLDDEIGDSRGVWVSEQTCAPCWSLPHVDKQAQRLKDTLDNILVRVGVLEECEDEEEADA